MNFSFRRYDVGAVRPVPLSQRFLVVLPLGTGGEQVQATPRSSRRQMGPLGSTSRRSQGAQGKLSLGVAGLLCGCGAHGGPGHGAGEFVPRLPAPRPTPAASVPVGGCFLFTLKFLAI